MLRKIIASLIIGILLTLLSVPAWAAVSDSVPFHGQAQFITTRTSSQLVMSLSSSDNSGWEIQTTLVPVAFQNSESERESDSGSVNSVQLSGDFTLIHNQSPFSGTVLGWIYSSGQGQLTLLNATQSINLQMSFTIIGDLSVTANAVGQFGSITTISPPVTNSTAGSSPAGSGTAIQAVPPQTAASPIASQPDSQAASVATVAANDSGTGQQSQAPQTHIFWYISRTSAILAYILLFLNIVFGLGLKTNFGAKISARWLSFELHRFTAMLAMALIMLHVFSLLGDQYMSPALRDLLVPLSGSYRPVWTALGIVSFYLLIVVALSSYLRRFIGQKIWRIIHMISFVLFYVILYHGLRSGTDTSTWWAQTLYVVTGAGATFLFLWRFLLANLGRNEASIQNSGKEIERQSPGDAIK